MVWFKKFDIHWVGELAVIGAAAYFREKPLALPLYLRLLCFLPFTGKFCIHDYYLYHVFIFAVDLISNSRSDTFLDLVFVTLSLFGMIF